VRTDPDSLACYSAPVHGCSNHGTDLAPEFERCLDPVYMRSAFMRNLPECVSGAWTIVACEIHHPRYKTYLLPASRGRSNLSVVYYLRGQHTATAVLTLRILHARIYFGSLAEREYQHRQSTGAGSVGFVAELGLLYWRFPEDPALPWLSDLVDPKRVVRHWPDAVVDRSGASAGLEVTVVNYRPEVRCTLSYSWRSCTGEHRPRLYAKSYAAAEGPAIYERMAIIHANSRAGGFLTAEPLAYDDDRKVIWQACLHGSALSLHNVYPDVTGGIARGLAALQATELPGLTLLTQTAYLQEAQKKLQKLQHAFPGHAASLLALGQRLQTTAPSLGDMICTTLHGDFHIGQLLRCDERIALFDFDELQRGDPLVDLANFLADVHYHAGKRSARIWQTLLVRDYAAAVDWPVEPRRLAWHLAIQHLTRAYRAYIQQSHDLHKRVADTVATALQVLQPDVPSSSQGQRLEILSGTRHG
jgi:hypothetical protein